MAAAQTKQYCPVSAGPGACVRSLSDAKNICPALEPVTIFQLMRWKHFITVIKNLHRHMALPPYATQVPIIP